MMRGPAGGALIAVAAGDTTSDIGPALEFGQTLALSVISCGSEPSGVRCKNSDGHGFVIAREAYQLF